jgi:16S rRNA (guanine966-N2)-methyltransferase
VRIIGGIAGGRLLATPKGLTVRPTPDLVRQAVFNSLGPVLEGAAVLDLFSGTGALGLECLSRGAGRVLSVELSSRHARFIRQNVEDLELPRDRHELRVQDVFVALRQLVAGPLRFDFIVADPPFGPKTAAERSRSASQKLLDLAEVRTLLVPGGRLVLGHARRDRVEVGAAWRELRLLEHGDSTFRILTPGGDGSGPQSAATA